MKPLLSILIPTYNRAAYLDRLLSYFETELRNIDDKDRVEIIIGDNCSDDSTQRTALAYSSRNENWLYNRRASNLGPDLNMTSLLESAKGSYCWFIGDDDLPRISLIHFVHACILDQRPSLLYLPSAWAPDVSAVSCSPLSSLNIRSLPPHKFASTVNIWTTFISSWVFRLDSLNENPNALNLIRLGLGTHFVQLGWILPLLSTRGPFLLSTETCILATSANTGGYSSLEVFGLNYSKQVNRFVHDKLLRNCLLNPFLAGFLPRLIVIVKSGRDFSPKMINAGSSLRSRIIKEHCTRPIFYVLCLPMLFLPSSFIRNVHKLYIRVMRPLRAREKFAETGSLSRIHNWQN